MSIIQPIPLSKLGEIFGTWRNAPPGQILAYGSRCARGEGNNWHEFQTQMITVRAEGDGDLGAMVALLPEVQLILEPPAQGQYRMFECTMTYDNSAVDLSGQYEIAIARLSPAAAKAEFDLGDVVLTSDHALIAYVGMPSHERFLVLRGETPWKLIGRPRGTLHVLGKLTVQAKVQ